MKTVVTQPSKLIDLEERVDHLEAQMRVLMLRTSSMVRLGPSTTNVEPGPMGGGA